MRLAGTAAIGQPEADGVGFMYSSASWDWKVAACTTPRAAAYSGRATHLSRLRLRARCAGPRVAAATGASGRARGSRSNGMPLRRFRCRSSSALPRRSRGRAAGHRRAALRAYALIGVIDRLLRANRRPDRFSRVALFGRPTMASHLGGRSHSRVARNMLGPSIDGDDGPRLDARAETGRCAEGAWLLAARAAARDPRLPQVLPPGA